MCGICGFLGAPAGSGAADMVARVGRMADTLSHRGPDDAGSWADPEAGIALGHRRLSIIDLSPQGHQPMVSADGRFVIVYNGEIYNFRDLRAELERAGRRFRGHSDTEVMLEAVTAWGVEAAVKRFAGMFAFGLWDRRERTLYLARDRVGEKPLYYGCVNGRLLFGSELKALRAHPDWRGELNRDVLPSLLRYGYLPAPYSIYRGVFKLRPGTLLAVRAGALAPLPDPVPYWTMREAAERGEAGRWGGSDEEAVDELGRLLKQVVAREMIADVPLGAFLSGGTDSSLVVALMQQLAGRPVKTFTMGFREAAYDEAPYAEAVARHLGTEHHPLYVSPADALEIIPRIPSLFDEPFADSSQVPTLMVAQLARREVTVCLSGDAGDELFGGYGHYRKALRIWRLRAALPRAARRALAAGLRLPPVGLWDGLLSGVTANGGDRVHKLGEMLLADGREGFFDTQVSFWRHPEGVVLGASGLPPGSAGAAELPRLRDTASQFMFYDSVRYLPDDILVKVDRASMAVSLETRVPLLDHQVVEFAWRLGPGHKLRGGRSKWILRRLLDRYLPAHLFERPKHGFCLPVDVWLRTELRDWAESLLDENRLRQDGYFEPAVIRRKWNEHLSGRHNWQYALWHVLMFQGWLDAQRI